MHRSVRLKYHEYCTMDWSISWSIGTTRRFYSLTSFCREQTVEIEFADRDLTVQKKPTMKFVRKLTDPQRSERPTSKRRSTVRVKFARIWRWGKLWRESCGGETLESWHPVTHLQKIYCGRKVVECNFGFWDPASRLQNLCCENRFTERRLWRQF